MARNDDFCSALKVFCVAPRLARDGRCRSGMTENAETPPPPAFGSIVFQSHEDPRGVNRRGSSECVQNADRRSLRGKTDRHQSMRPLIGANRASRLRPASRRKAPGRNAACRSAGPPGRSAPASTVGLDERETIRHGTPGQRDALRGSRRWKQAARSPPMNTAARGDSSTGTLASAPASENDSSARTSPTTQRGSEQRSDESGPQWSATPAARPSMVFMSREN
jgi:hypothetical protein